MMLKLAETESTDFIKPIPVNREAEQALLGALLHNNLSLEKVIDFLKPEHFADGIHGKIFHAICKIVEQGSVADPITLKTFFDKDDLLSSVGGGQYLIELADSVVSLGNTHHYGKTIYDLYLRRQLINIGDEIIETARSFSVEETAKDQIKQAEEKLVDLDMNDGQQSRLQSFETSLTEALKMAEIAYKRDSKVVGVTTGLHDLDKWLGGLHPSDLIIIAGRPSMGKTALATNIAFNAALAKAEKKTEGGNVVIFSLEMSADQLANRLLAQEAKISSDRIRRGELKATDFPSLIESSRRISKIPLYIDDTPALTVAGLRIRARRLQRQKGLDLIVIDYLQLLQGGNEENRVQEISQITRGLKALAKELNVPIIAASQLSRAVEQRDDKHPQLADLRESGSIEQDADVVIFLYREEYYEARKEPEPGTEKYGIWQEKMEAVQNQAEAIIAKQRHGPVGTIRLFFDARFTKFGDLAQQRY